MAVQEFVAVTRRVIAAEGFDDFLPTACYPERQEVATLRGLPPDIEPEPAVLKWAAKKASPGELYLVAFKSGPTEFTVIRVHGTEKQLTQYGVEP